MDRRQRKTREAIFKAFEKLLSEKNINKITVNDIIAEADVGRTTFYDHFETKDALLKDLNDELFCHVFDCMNNSGNDHKHIFFCNAPDSVFLHLFQHIYKNDNHILELLSCQNNDIFLMHFKNRLKDLIESKFEMLANHVADDLPKDFWINHIANTFVETVRWWLYNKRLQSPDTIYKYFLTALQIPEI